MSDSDAAAIATELLNPLQFVTPTEFVELPSKGKGYPPEFYDGQRRRHSYVPNSPQKGVGSRKNDAERHY